MPYGLKGELLLKAPSFKEHKKQEELGESFKPSEKVAQEVLAAYTIAMALDDEDIRLRLGEHFNVYRYADGIGVTMPSGWVTFIPLQGQKLPPRPPKDEPEEGDPGEQAA